MKLSTPASLIVSPTIVLASFLAFGSVPPAHAQSTPQSTAKVGLTFDTRYTSSSAAIVAFDDGRQTYLALSGSVKDLPSPVVMSIGAAGEVLLQPTQMSPYLQLTGLHSRIRLVWGNGREATLTYSGPAAVERLGQAGAFGSVSPVATYGAMGKPSMATAGVTANASSSGGLTPPAPIATTAVSANAAAPALQPSQATQPPPIVEQVWEIKPTDANLAMAFERWSAAAGLKLLWDAQQHVTLSTSDSFVGTFEEAVTRVLSSPAIRKSKYPLEGCIYNNTPPVLRITALGEQECSK